MVNYENLKHKDKNRRSYNYKKLRKAGFNSHEANRFKDFSTNKIITLILNREQYNEATKEVAGDTNG